MIIIIRYQFIHSDAMLQWCISDVAVVRRWYSSGAAVVHMWCISDAAVVRRGYSSGAAVVLQWCICGASVMLQ